MILFPAIDLKDGQCVRLIQGDMDAATVFSDDPAAQAKSFEDQGFQYLHMVDLNGAFEGKPVNGAAVDAILAAISMPVQLGGGIRDMATIEAWLTKGISRIILGTVAVTNPDLVREACKEFPGKIAVGIDARNGMVAIEGWAETSGTAAMDLAMMFEFAGVIAITIRISIAMACLGASIWKLLPNWPARFQSRSSRLVDLPPWKTLKS